MTESKALENLKYAHACDVALDLSSQDVHELWAEIETRDKRVAELEAEVAELKPYRDGYDPEEVFPPENEWVWLRDFDDYIQPVQYSRKTEWYWNYDGVWMPDDDDIRRWYPIGKLPEEREE
jgi:hypothetical protein